MFLVFLIISETEARLALLSSSLFLINSSLFLMSLSSFGYIYNIFLKVFFSFFRVVTIRITFLVVSKQMVKYRIVFG